MFYELSEIILFEQKCPFDSVPLALEIIYSEVDMLTEKDFLESYEERSFQFQSTQTSAPNFKNYNVGFQKGMSELLDGNSYQFNYTQQFSYKLGDCDKEIC